MTDEEAIQPEHELDATNLNNDQLIQRLNEFDTDATIRIGGIAETQSGVLAGLNRSMELKLPQNLGRFACMASSQATIDVAGSVGLACANSFRSGNLLVRGEAGNFLAAYAIGGYIAVHGKAGDFAGYGLAGGDLLVRSRCGNGAGALMRSGTLVIGNGCQDNLGFGMTGGTIYVRGEIGSVAEGVRVSRLKEADTIRLSLMLVRAGIKTTYERFQVFRAKGDKGER
jgi:formylmethanofuran dehydrogenase subunit C